MHFLLYQKAGQRKKNLYLLFEYSALKKSVAGSHFGLASVQFYPSFCLENLRGYGGDFSL